MARAVFKTAEAGASRLVGSIPTLSRQPMVSKWSAPFCSSPGNREILLQGIARGLRNYGDPSAYAGLHESGQPLSIPVGARCLPTGPNLLRSDALDGQIP